MEFLDRPAGRGFTHRRWRWLVTRPGLLVLIALAACNDSELPKPAIHDELVGLTRDDFATALSRPGTPPVRSREVGRDKKAKLLASRPAIDPGPLVTLSVNETVPLKDVLISLARQADREIEIDPRIEGGIILSVRNRPFLKVVERIAKLGGLRFTTEDGILRVELDEPFHRAYNLSFLDVERQFSSTVSTSVSVFTSSSGSGGGGGGNGSTNSIETRATNNMWNGIEATLSQLLADHAPARLVSSSLGESDLVQVTPTTGETVSLATEPNGDNLVTAVLTQAQATMQAVSGNGTPATATPPATAAAGDGTDSGNSSYFTLNRTAGLLDVYGTELQQAAVADYLQRAERSLTSQVLIEAKILEVKLNEEYHTGINWRAVVGDVSAAAPFTGALSPVPGPFDTLASAVPDAFSIALDRNDFDAVLSLVEGFGTTRTLSSPRVTVMQGHTAVLKVTENRVFFQLSYEREEQDNGNDRITVSSDVNTVPVGVVITVQPAIDLDNDTVSMTLRPTVTRVTGTVDDPAVSIASDNSVRSVVPVVAVQEIDSVVKMDSGDTIIMGGLMQDNALRDDQGVPFLSQLPLLGTLFRARDETTDQTELVIFLRATIVDPDGDHVGDKDLELYRTFAKDPRPFTGPRDERPLP